MLQSMVVLYSKMLVIIFEQIFYFTVIAKNTFFTALYPLRKRNFVSATILLTFHANIAIYIHMPVPVVASF